MLTGLWSVSLLTSKQGAFSIKTRWGSGRFRRWATVPTSGKREMPLCNWQNESSWLCCLKYSETHESKLNLSLTFEVFIFYILVDLIYKNFLMLLRFLSFIPSYPWVPHRRIQPSPKITWFYSSCLLLSFLLHNRRLILLHQQPLVSSPWSQESTLCWVLRKLLSPYLLPVIEVF